MRAVCSVLRICGRGLPPSVTSSGCRPAAVQSWPGDALLLCLMVLPRVELGLCASRPRSGIDEAGISAAEVL